jgi:NTP pyrophosphatase (non-canonical NTP hydrolase)
MSERSTPWWAILVEAELARARAKFPSPDHLTLALAEESGEVVKAMLDLRYNKPDATWAQVEHECIQTMAMCVRLMEECDPAVLPRLP